jgi:hypothetical protein
MKILRFIEFDILISINLFISYWIFLRRNTQSHSGYETSISTPEKTFARASTILKIAMRTWCQLFRWLSKTQDESDEEGLRCFAFSVKMQAKS